MTDTEVPAAHRAIQLARQGRMLGPEMLDLLVAGKLGVPLSEVPRIENNTIQGWRPATVSRADGSQWLVAFTQPELASTYGDQETSYPFCMTVDARWVLEAMPPDYGIVFNLGTEDVFQWNAQGLAKYKKDVLGW